MRCALKVLEKYLKTVLDEVHFTVNLYSFLLPLTTPGKLFVPLGNSFAPSQAQQLSKLQNKPPSLDTLTIA